MKFFVWLKIYWIKFITLIETLLSKLVYNFHKVISGVKTRKNIRYVEEPNRYERFDVYYPDKKSETGEPYPTICYFHGGGWASYSKHIFTTLSRRLAKMGYVVFCCNYSLAPKYKMEKIIDDAIAATKSAIAHTERYGGDPNRIIFGGDSAGGHISAMLMALTTNGDKRCEFLIGKIKALILFYGVFNMETMLDTGFPNIKALGTACIEGGLQNTDALKKYSPINYDLSNFAPCFLASGEVDKLHSSQSATMLKKLKESGIKTEHLFFSKREYKAMHAYMTVDGISTNVQTLEKVKKFLKEVGL